MSLLAFAQDELVGRSREQTVLAQFLDGASRRRAAVLLEGPPGIGKTTLWRWVLTGQAEQAVVHTCRPGELDTTLSYSALEDLMADADGLAGLQRLLTDLRGATARAPRDASRDPAVEVHGTAQLVRVGQQVVDALDASPASAIFVGIDDVQWLDEASARVFTFVVRHVRQALVVVATQRGTGVPDWLRMAIGDDDILRLPVGALTQGDVSELIRRKLGLSLVRNVVARVHRASGGNPLFALELARMLAERSEPMSAWLHLPLPTTLRETIGRRVAALPEDVRDVLLVVACAGDPTADVVHALAGVDTGTLLQHAIDQGVLGIDGGKLHFTHPLLAEVALANSDRAQVRRMHALLAERAVDPEERGRHLAAATDLPDDVVATEIEAGSRLAHARGGVDVAASLAGRALALTPPTETEARFRRTLLSADRLWDLGETAASINLLHEALDAGGAIGPQRAALLQRLARAATQGGAPGEAVSMLRVARRDCGADTWLRAVLHRDLAFRILQGTDVRRARSHMRATMRLAEYAGDDQLKWDAEAALLSEVVIAADLPPDLSARLDSLATVEENLDGLVPAGSRLISIGAIYKWLDEFDTARCLLDKVRQQTWDNRADGALAPPLFQLAELECWAGRLDDARELTDELDRLATRADRAAVTTMHLYARALLNVRTGEIAASIAAGQQCVRLAAAHDNARHHMRGLAVLGFAQLCAGDPAAALANLASATDLQLQLGYHNPAVIRSSADEIEALVLTNELDTARSRLTLLEEHAERARSPWARLAAQRSKALIYAADGELPAAIEALTAATQTAASVDDPLERGRTWLALGSALRRARHRHRALDALTTAEQLFGSMPAPHWVEKARSEGARIRTTRGDAVRLSPMELRVARMVADGRSNKEIAALAFMSVKTVETHLTRTYRKLGIRSRAELTARVLAME